MRIVFTPLLAAKKPKDYTDDMFFKSFRFPVGATPKFDGIRGVCMPLPEGNMFEDRCFPACRSLKAVPNLHIRKLLATLPPGPDGELITYEKNGQMRSFNRVQSDVMSQSGIPTFKFHVFDWAYFDNLRYDEVHEKDLGYLKRFDRVTTSNELKASPFVVPVIPVICNNLKELLAYEEDCVQQGFEGVCFRRLDTRYKFGRSTLNEHILVAMKRFVDEEAVIIGMTEEMQNNNPLTLDERGYAERSSHKDNMLGKQSMGALVVRNHRGEFKIGIGFTAAMKKDYWSRKDELIGQIAVFKHQPHGAKELPRIGVFKGFRSRTDMDPESILQYKLDL